MNVETTTPHKAKEQHGRHRLYAVRHLPAHLEGKVCRLLEMHLLSYIDIRNTAKTFKIYNRRRWLFMALQS